MTIRSVTAGARWALPLLAGVLVATGCTGSEQPTTTAGVELARADLARLVAVSPTATGWESTTWKAMPGSREPFTRADLDKGVGLDASDPSFEIQAALAGAMQDAGFVESRQRAWQGDEGVAHSFAQLFRTDEGMGDALAASRAFADRWYPTIEHREIEAVDAADGLGDGSWAVRGGTAPAAFVELSWVRGNALLAVYLTCARCPTDVEAAARSWADAIDAEALARAQ